MTPGNNFIAGVVDCCDDRGLFFLKNCLARTRMPLWKDSNISGRQGQTRPLMVSLEPPWKDASIDTPHTLTRGPEAAKTTSNQNGEISSRRSWTQPPIVSFELLWKDASIDTPHTLITGVVVTADKFIAGINDTGNHWNPWQRLIGGVVDTSDKFIANVVDTGEQLIAGVIDIGDKHSFKNCIKFETAPREYSWAGGHWFMKKNLKSKISCQTPFHVNAQLCR